jgi:hypothetical protein
MYEYKKFWEGSGGGGYWLYSRYILRTIHILLIVFLVPHFYLYLIIYAE